MKILKGKDKHEERQKNNGRLKKLFESQGERSFGRIDVDRLRQVMKDEAAKRLEQIDSVTVKDGLATVRWNHPDGTQREEHIALPSAASGQK